jgi:arylsulfatase A-like enzyme
MSVVKIIVLKNNLYGKLSNFKIHISVGALVAIVIVFAIVYQSISSEPRSKKNILIISADAIRPDRFSFNGYSRKTTPNIDKAIRDGLQFRNVITTVPRTFPSWVSMLTSQTPLSHEIKHMFPRSRERSERVFNAVTKLNSEGYYTSVISDFAGDIFPRYDFDFQTVKAPTLNFDILIKQIILEKQTYLLPIIINNWFGHTFFPETRGIAKLPDSNLITSETIEQIEAAGDKPFLVTAFYSITHFPFSAPYPYYKKYAKRDYRGPFKYLKQVILDLGGKSDKATEGFKELPKSDKQQINDLYDGCLNLFDKEFGTIIKYLEDNDKLKDTIVLIYSDHGENIYDFDFGMGHGEHLKGNIALEVACVMLAPEIENLKNKKNNKAFSQVDIMPTIFDLAGISKPKSFRGRSVFSKEKREVDAYAETGIWFDNNQKTNLFFQKQRIIYPDITGISDLDFDYHNEMVLQQKYQNVITGSKHRAIYSGNYKLIYIPLQSRVKFELYNFIKDPQNQEELSSKELLVFKRMKAKFYKYIEDEGFGNFIFKNGYVLPYFSDPVY